ncbi:hypothetical protein BC830DRAFT_1164389 [Chytriomyces sp. MP71]|nr:hypothetical protein BC830DRAFT_1164389 [Chytriomyces sp. MP71]
MHPCQPRLATESSGTKKQTQWTGLNKHAKGRTQALQRQRQELDESDDDGEGDATEAIAASAEACASVSAAASETLVAVPLLPCDSMASMQRRFSLDAIPILRLLPAVAVPTAPTKTAESGAAHTAGTGTVSNWNAVEATVFTTPSLDYPHFAALIYAHIHSLQNDIRSLSAAHVLAPQHDTTNTTAIEAFRRANLARVVLVAQAISAFNHLTAPRASTPSIRKPSIPLPHPDPVYPISLRVSLSQQTPPPSSSVHPETYAYYLKLVDSLNSPHASFDITLSTSARAVYHYQRALLYSQLPWRDDRVGEDLGRCLKLLGSTTPLCPTPPSVPGCLLPESAWNLMGEWYCKGGLWQLGQTCFEQGLKKNRNRDCLLNLAQVWRSKPISPETLDMSEKLCNEALALHENDGRSWFGLGCMQLKRFFGLTFDARHLNASLEAYNKAELDPNFASDPDLYGNRASVYLYAELYQESLRDFSRSVSLDPFQCGISARPKMVAMKTMLRTVHAAVADHTAVSSSSPTSAAMHEKSVGAKKRKPATPPPAVPQGAGAKSRFRNPFAARGGTASAAANVGPLRGLEAAGMLAGACLLARDAGATGRWVQVEVLQSVMAGLPRTFVARGTCGHVLAVSLFNVDAVIRAGDELVVFAPCFYQVEVDFEDCKVKYLNLRVDKPWLLAVNGKVVEKQNVSLTSARFESV